MFRFKGRVFVQVETQWFVWEPVWDSMRPIDGFVWTGTRYEIVDTTFTKDPFSETFGYGTQEIKDYCEKLTEHMLDSIESAPVVQTAEVGDPVWFRDRYAVVSDMSADSWRRHAKATGQRCRSARREPRGKRVTKRVLPTE